MLGDNIDIVPIKRAKVEEDLKEERKYDFDLIVIGGGSGGLAAAQEAAELGASVACFDYVKPSPQGTSWGLGGTCVNVGCIPKKMMHYAALLGESFSDAEVLGWKGIASSEGGRSHDWNDLVDSVRAHIMSLNFGYRSKLMQKKVRYINAYARFINEHEVSYVLKEENLVASARYFIVATGVRPVYPPSVPGVKELAITSDDIFYWSKYPGKTLLIGASYISLECAGFLRSLGCDVTVMVRSILLRGFDQECAEKIGKSLENIGVKFYREFIPIKLEKEEDGKILVSYHPTKGGDEQQEIFDTVVFATGREATTNDIGLNEIGIQLNPKNKKIITDDTEASTLSHIFAIGDTRDGQMELTPLAISSGRLLARRLFNNSLQKMRYDLVPTTVFTPMEYGCCGLSEEDAITKYGEDNIEVYLSEFNTLELLSTHRMTYNGEDMENPCFCKLICVINENLKVVGLHIVSPNAGEITQGFALAMRLGATKADFDSCIGIHPVTAEEFTLLRVTRRSGEDYAKSGC